MVTWNQKQARFLGTIMLVGSFAGVGLSLIGVVILAILGADLSDWTLTADGWWSPDYALLRFLTGLGILFLAASPIVMLLTFSFQAARARQYKTVLIACGLLAILACGLLINLLGIELVSSLS
jgi:hypothetical protein